MWFQALVAVIQILPSLVEVVGVLTKQVEPESPHGGGASQKDAVVGVIKAGINASDAFARDGEVLNKAEKDAVVLVADQTVDLIVGMYNAVGTFKKSS